LVADQCAVGGEGEWGTLYDTKARITLRDKFHRNSGARSQPFIAVGAGERLHTSEMIQDTLRGIRKTAGLGQTAADVVVK